LTLTDPCLLRVANTPNTQFLLQPELRATQQGLEYRERQVGDELTYKGYINKDGQFEGVGLFKRTNDDKFYGEWHLNNRHGCGKVEWADGGSWWGEYKDGKKEGYGTYEGANGDSYIG
jgi:hypothetical protein